MLAADRRRKEPRTLPRPGQSTTPVEGLTGTPDTGMQARGLAGMLAMTQVHGDAVLGHE